MKKGLLVIGLGMLMVLGLAMTVASTEVTTTWTMADGTVEYQATSYPGPAAASDIAPVVTDLTVTGLGSGHITTRNVPDGPHQLVEEHLVASGFDAGLALDYMFNANDDYYNQHPSTGFELNADAYGNYVVDIESRQWHSVTEVALNLDMFIPQGGMADVTFEQEGSGNEADAWLNLSPGEPGDYGSLTMVKPAAGCQLAYTVIGNMEAQGSGDFGLVGSKTPGVFDFKTVGTVDGIALDDVDADDVEAISVIGSFVNGLDLADNWTAHLPVAGHDEPDSLLMDSTSFFNATLYDYDGGPNVTHQGGKGWSGYDDGYDVYQDDGSGSGWAERVYACVQSGWPTTYVNYYGADAFYFATAPATYYVPGVDWPSGIAGDYGVGFQFAFDGILK